MRQSPSLPLPTPLPASLKWLSLFVSLVLASVGGPVLAAQDNPDDTLAALLASSIQTVMGVSDWPCLYSGHFQQQRSLPGSNARLTSTGQFLYSCEQGLLWEIHKPIVESVVYTHSGQHYQVRAGGKVKPLTGKVQQRVAGLLLSLLGGDAAGLSQDFDARVSASDPGHLSLLPNKVSLRQQIQQITLNYSKGIMNVEIQAISSGNTVLQIDQLSIHSQLPVVACAAISQLPDIACQRLFDPVRNEQ